MGSNLSIDGVQGPERVLKAETVAALKSTEMVDEMLLNQPLPMMMFDVKFLEEKHPKFDIHVARWGPTLSLPKGWVEHVDLKQHRFYYYHEETKSTTWSDPRERIITLSKKATAYQPLPEGWEERLDPRVGRVFYFDRKTGRSQWDDPRSGAAKRVGAGVGGSDGIEDEIDDMDDESDDEEESEWADARQVVSYVASGLLTADHHAFRLVLTNLFEEGNTMVLPLRNNDETLHLLKRRLGLLYLFHLALSRDRERPPHMPHVVPVEKNQQFGDADFKLFKKSKDLNPQVLETLKRASLSVNGTSTCRCLCIFCGQHITQTEMIGNSLIPLQLGTFGMPRYGYFHTTLYKCGESLREKEEKMDAISVLFGLELRSGKLHGLTDVVNEFFMLHYHDADPGQFGFFDRFYDQLADFQIRYDPNKLPATSEWDKKFPKDSIKNCKDLNMRHRHGYPFAAACEITSQLARLSSEMFESLTKGASIKGQNIFQKPFTLDITSPTVFGLVSILQHIAEEIVSGGHSTLFGKEKPVKDAHLVPKSLDLATVVGLRSALRLIEIHLFFIKEGNFDPQSTLSELSCRHLRRIIVRLLQLLYKVPDDAIHGNIPDFALRELHQRTVSIWKLALPFFYPSVESRFDIFLRLVADLSKYHTNDIRVILADCLAQSLSTSRGLSFFILPKNETPKLETDTAISDLEGIVSLDEFDLNALNTVSSEGYNGRLIELLVALSCRKGYSTGGLQNLILGIIRDVMSRASQCHDAGSAIVKCSLKCVQIVFDKCKAVLDSVPNSANVPDVLNGLKSTIVWSCLPTLIETVVLMADHVLYIGEKIMPNLVGLVASIKRIISLDGKTLFHLDGYFMDKHRTHPKPQLNELFADVPWLVETQRQLAWLGGKLAATLIASTPLGSEEKDLLGHLKSAAFVSGIEEQFLESHYQEGIGTQFSMKSDSMSFGGASSGSKDIDFAVEIINASEQGGELNNWMQKNIMELRMARLGGEMLDRALRGIVAVTLKLNGLLGLARKAAECLPEKPDEKLQRIWKTANKFRSWAIQEKQNASETDVELTYDSLAKKILRKCQLLMQLAAPEHLGPSKKPLLVRIATASGLDPKAVEWKKLVNAHRIFAQWKTYRKGGDSGEEEAIQSLNKSLSRFIQSDLKCSEISNLMLQRVRRAYLRNLGFEHMLSLLSSTFLQSVQAEIIWHLSQTWQTIPLEPNESGHHFLDHLEGCGIPLKKSVEFSFQRLLGVLLKMTSVTTPSLLLCSSALHSLSLRYKPSDGKLLRQTGMFDRLLDLCHLETGYTSPHFMKENPRRAGVAMNVEIRLLRNLAFNVMRAHIGGIFDITAIPNRDPLIVGITSTPPPLNEYQLYVIKKIYDELAAGAVHTMGLNWLDDAGQPAFCVNTEKFVQLYTMLFTASVNPAVQVELSKGRFIVLLFSLLYKGTPRIQRLTLRFLRSVLPRSTHMRVSSTLQSVSAFEDGGSGVTTMLLLFVGRILAIKGKSTYPYERLVRIASEAIALIRLLIDRSGWKQSVFSALEEGLRGIPSAIEDIDDIKSSGVARVIATLAVLGGHIEGFRVGGRVLVNTGGRPELGTLVEQNIGRSTMKVVLDSSRPKMPVEFESMTVTAMEEVPFKPDTFDLSLELASSFLAFFPRDLDQLESDSPEHLEQVLRPQSSDDDPSSSALYYMIRARALRSLSVFMESSHCAEMLVKSGLVNALVRTSVQPVSVRRITCLEAAEKKVLELEELLHDQGLSSALQMVANPLALTLQSKGQFSLAACSRALAACNNNLEKAEQFLNASIQEEKKRERIRQLQMDPNLQMLSSMGFPVELCQKAITLHSDLNLAANWLLENGAAEMEKMTQGSDNDVWGAPAGVPAPPTEEEEDWGEAVGLHDYNIRDDGLDEAALGDVMNRDIKSREATIRLQRAKSTSVNLDRVRPGDLLRVSNRGLSGQEGKRNMVGKTGVVVQVEPYPVNQITLSIFDIASERYFDESFTVPELEAPDDWMVTTFGIDPKALGKDTQARMLFDLEKAVAVLSARRAVVTLLHHGRVTSECSFSLKSFKNPHHLVDLLKMALAESGDDVGHIGDQKGSMVHMVWNTLKGILQDESDSGVDTLWSADEGVSVSGLLTQEIIRHLISNARDIKYVESRHNTTQTLGDSHRFEGATALAISFDNRCDLSGSTNDFLELFEGESNEPVVRLTGKGPFEPIIVLGSKVTWRSTTTYSYKTHAWGFRFRIRPLGFQPTNEQRLLDIPLGWPLLDLVFNESPHVVPEAYSKDMFNVMARYLRTPRAPCKLRVIRLLIRMFRAIHTMDPKKRPKLDLKQLMGLSKEMMDEHRKKSESQLADSPYFQAVVELMIECRVSLPSDRCTFAMTGISFIEQPSFFCYSCDPGRKVQICVVCAQSCHEGHHLSKVQYSTCFCDCGGDTVSGKIRGKRVNCTALDGVTEDAQENSSDVVSASIWDRPDGSLSWFDKLIQVADLTKSLSSSQSFPDAFLEPVCKEAGVTMMNGLSSYDQQAAVILRQQMISLENAVSRSAKFGRWSRKRKDWIERVQACGDTREFAGLISVFEAELKYSTKDHAWCVGSRYDWIDRMEHCTSFGTLAENLIELQNGIISSKISWKRHEFDAWVEALTGLSEESKNSEAEKKEVDPPAIVWVKKWSLAKDEQLVSYINSYCSTKKIKADKIRANTFQIDPNQLIHYPLLKDDLTNDDIKVRFVVIREFNRRLRPVLPLFQSSTSHGLEKGSLAFRISALRGLLQNEMKKEFWSAALKEGYDSREEKMREKIVLNRLRATKIRKDGKQSVFAQAARQLLKVDPILLCKRQRAFFVKFKGEGSDDYGGPYREAVASFCDELMSDKVPLFLLCANGVHKVSFNREQYVINPSCSSPYFLQLYEFFGMLLGIAIRTNTSLALNLPSLFWKRLVKQEVDINDLQAVDHSCVDTMQRLIHIEEEGIDETTFEYVIFDVFTTHSSDGREIDLKENGSAIPVTWTNRQEYARLVVQYRISEGLQQMDAIYRGVEKILPARLLSLFTWQEVEEMICGKAEFDLDLLKRNTKYGVGVSKNARHVEMFWSIMEEFSDAERRLFLRFVWGHNRLPNTDGDFDQLFTIHAFHRSGKIDNYFPVSHTCFFSIELPSYSAKTIMKEKLLYAITHCTAIDADNTTEGARNRDMGLEDDEEDDW